MKQDIYSYGVISSSKLYLLGDDFPQADAYAEIKRSYQTIGGEAANSSIALSKLGLKVKIDGNWLGSNEADLWTRQFLADCGIDTSGITVKTDYEGVQEIVFADRKTRTVFGTYTNLLEKREWNRPNEDDIVNSSMVCLDPFFQDASKEAARICVEHAIPYVTVDCEYTSGLAQNAAAIIIAGEFRGSKYRDVDVLELYAKYRERCSGLVIFTFGNRPILYSRKDQDVQEFEPYSVEAVDTSGAGDSFRSGIMYGLLNGWTDEKTISFASAIAAMVCVTLPGVLNAPGLDGVERFCGGVGWIVCGVHIIC